MNYLVHTLAPLPSPSAGADIPRGKISWKFVLVLIGGDCVLVTGPLSLYPYHANLLDRFCEEREIAASWAKKPDMLELFDPAVKICGGGYFSIDLAEKTILALGRSSAYGDFDRAYLHKVVESAPFFTGFRFLLPDPR